MGKENMIKKIKELNSVLAELIAGIILVGMVCEFTGVWFVTDKVKYSLGLMIGVILAAAMAIHMAWALDIAVSMDAGGAEKKIRFNSIFRYLVVVVILFVVMVTKFANPLAAFLGIMSLKAAAYLQPSIHRLKNKLFGKEEEKKSMRSK